MTIRFVIDALQGCDRGVFSLRELDASGNVILTRYTVQHKPPTYGKVEFVYHPLGRIQAERFIEHNRDAIKKFLGR
jgi:hypothetical protein